MILFQHYLANQGSNNCCWLYAPALAQCSIPGKQDFEAQVEYFKQALLSQGYKSTKIDKWFKQGVLPGSNVLSEMGLAKIGDLEDYATDDATETYWKIYDLLTTQGPFVLQYPSLGSGHVHQAAVVGLIFGKESMHDPADQVHLITPHTQNVRLTVLPVPDVLELSQRRTVPVEILKVPYRLVTPLRPDHGTIYSASGVSAFAQESMVLARSFSLSNLFSFG